jgi:hypothetical protein
MGYSLVLLQANCKVARPAMNTIIEMVFFAEVLYLNNFIGLPPYFVSYLYLTSDKLDKNC